MCVVECFLCVHLLLHPVAVPFLLASTFFLGWKKMIFFSFHHLIRILAVLFFGQLLLVDSLPLATGTPCAEEEKIYFRDNNENM